MRERLFKVLVPCLSATLSFLALETTARVYGDNFVFRNNLGAERTLLDSTYPAVYSAEPGWTPEPGASCADNIWRTEVTILPDGIRSNGGPAGPAAASGPDLVVAVGDTWPAALERLSGLRTLNGGVFGYVLVQYVKDEAFDPAVLAKVGRVPPGLEGTGGRVIDLRAALAEVKAADGARFADFSDGHMTPLGNAFVARQVHQALQAAAAPGGV